MSDLLGRGLWAADGPAAAVGPEPLSASSEQWLDPLVDGELLGDLRKSASPRPSRKAALRDVLSRRPFLGRYVRPVVAGDCEQDLAWDAMLRAAATRAEPRPLVRSRTELLRKQRLRRPSRMVLFVVDISGSMGGAQMELARRLALSALQRAYVQRARVAMIAFRARSAAVLFGPTNQVARVHRTLRQLPVGGTTPLAEGLRLSYELLGRLARQDRAEHRAMVLVSDGRANVGRQAGYPALLAEVQGYANLLARMPALPIAFLDTTAAGKNDQPARWLAHHLDARRLQVGQLDHGPAALAPEVALLPTWW